MSKTILSFLLILVFASSFSGAQAESLREKLKRLQEALTQPVDAQKNNAVAPPSPSAASPSAASPAGGTESDPWLEYCAHHFGSGDLVVDYLDGKSAEDYIKQYFHLSADLSEKLRNGLDTYHQGSMPNMKGLVKELYMPEGSNLGRVGGGKKGQRNDMAYRLGRAFVDDPNIQNLANIIALTETKNGSMQRRPQDGPSVVVEAQTLLVLVMLQYPDLVIDKGAPFAILSKNRMGGQSILGRTLLARFYLFGDYAEQNIDTFNNMLGSVNVKVTGSGSLTYLNKRFALLNKPTFKDQTIYFALENIPNWNQRDRYLHMIQMNQQMQAQIQSRKGSQQASASLGKALLEVQQKLMRADELTFEALNAGPKFAELRAKGELLQREASGEANLVKVNVENSQSFLDEMNHLLDAGPKISDDSKAKLAEANQLRAQGMQQLRQISVAISFSVMSGGPTPPPEVAEAMYKLTQIGCKGAFRTVRFAREEGIPEATVEIDPGSEL